MGRAADMGDVLAVRERHFQDGAHFCRVLAESS